MDSQSAKKAFIANAPIGKLFFIDARTDATVPLKQGITMFLVPSDTPGFRRVSGKGVQ